MVSSHILNDGNWGGDTSFDAIVDQLPLGVFVIQDEVIKYANASFASLTGHTVQEVLGSDISQEMPHFIEGRRRERIWLRIAGGIDSNHFRMSGMRRDGQPVKVDVLGSHILFQGCSAVAGVAISGNKNLTAEQGESNEQLRALAAHINKDREKQRRIIARELHDVLGGILTSIKMDVSRIRRRLTRDEDIEIVNGIKELTREAHDAVRQISDTLHPSVLDHLGLAAAARRQLEAFAVRYGIACTMDSTESPLPITPAQAIAAYRIFQEALTNIARHSGAKRVRVAIRLDGKTLHLAVVDDGSGIAPEQLERPSIGLTGMRERAREAGGFLEISRGLDAGTVLRLILPPTAAYQEKIGSAYD